MNRSVFERSMPSDLIREWPYEENASKSTRF
jgi:hypothetical protein